jgi:hypothetical protein
MQAHKFGRRLLSLIIAIIFLTSPLLAQQRRGAPPRKTPLTEVAQPTPTFDSLLAAESYKAYFEVRGVGGLVGSPAVNDVLDPLLKLTGPDPEFDAAVKWLRAHAEILAGSRMLIAGWPNRPKLPNVLVAIEFSSPEEAKKFYPQLRGFLPTLIPTPTPASTPSPTPLASPTVSPKPTGDNHGGAQEVALGPGSAARAPAEVVRVEDVAPALPPYQMQQSGSLVLISDTPFTFRSLRPRNSKLLAEDQNFATARNRFASESVFLYVDLKSIEREEQEQRKKWEEESQKRSELDAANPASVEPDATELTPEMAEQVPPPPEPEPLYSPTLSATAEVPAGSEAQSGESARGTDVAGPLLNELSRALFSAPGEWPEAVSAGLVFEDDSYILRTLIINHEENKTIALPFVPRFVSGPPLVPESPGIFASDTDFFVSVSLDYQRIYEGLLQSFADQAVQAGRSGDTTTPPLSPFEVYEGKLGIKIKDDLLPLLGNEFAIAIPRKAPVVVPANTAKQKSDPAEKNARAPEQSPVFAIAIKDREAVSRLLPKIIESFGFKGASLLAQTEKRDGTELTSYGGLFAYAFVGEFLILSPDAQLTRHLVDSYLTHQTLSSDNHFRNFTRWQSRQVLGQVYVAPSLVEQYSSLMIMGGRRAERFGDALARINPVIDPLTYSLTNDGLGPLHELHVPKNLLQMLVVNTARANEEAPLQRNEATTKFVLERVAAAEARFQSTTGAGRYGTLEELLEAGIISKELLQNSAYTIQVNVSGNKFEATAIPVEYGKTGRISFFIDETGVLRSADRGGGAATVADEPD